MSRFYNIGKPSLILTLLGLFSLPVWAQLGFDIKLKKPKEYEERVLRSEKSTDKKLSLPGRLIQNTTSHYNYAFNAQNRINLVLQKAKENYKEDYSKLLSFYNYSLDETAKESVLLDSVILKASSGIALHDLRSDWADNLYLLWGTSYYLQKKFDSAYQLFQFINYAFAPKEKDGYYKTIGSARDGNAATSISTKEKYSLPKRLLSDPPSRNDAFIWQIRTYLAQDQFAEASTLIEALSTDANFPKRLIPDLEEVKALSFYKQEEWDSAASHLSKALDNTTTIQEKARWEYLIGQLYELAGKNKEARTYYNRSIPRTTDLIMEIYARLATIRCATNPDENNTNKNIAELTKMAQREKYFDYQDIIYYMAAQMALTTSNTKEAKSLLLKSTLATSNNPEQRNTTFLQLADLSYNDKEYQLAYNYYDSLKLTDKSLLNLESIKARKKSLALLIVHMDIINRQDSLQKIAALPEEERKDFVKKILKQLKKQQGLKDDNTFSTGNTIQTLTAPPTLFQPADSKGEWYFYNASLKSRGQMEFKSKWGNRPNVDNWRRSAAIMNNVANNPSNNQNPSANTNITSSNLSELSFESLYEQLPTTPEKLKSSTDSLQLSLYNAGKILIQEMQDCHEGTTLLNRIKDNNTSFEHIKDVYFNLYYCYNQHGEKAKADAIKKLMQEKYPNDRITQIINEGKDQTAVKLKEEANKRYDSIYSLFQNSQYEAAITAKKIADSLYGNSFWTPQLMYLEASYYAKKREDSSAINILTELVNRFVTHPIKDKAQRLLDAVKSRVVIESQINSLNNKTAPAINNSTAPASNNPAPVANNTNAPLTNAPINNVSINSSFVNDANATHYAMLVLKKVDLAFINESKYAFNRYNRENFPNKNFNIEVSTLNADYKLLLIQSFGNAREASAYAERTRAKLASDILPWLTQDQYELLIISESNNKILTQSKDLEAYKKWVK
jgi:hypothetical protein